MKIKFNKKGSELYFPPSSDVEELKNVTHVAICAHQDDAEIMAFDGIFKCYNSPTDKFLAVVVTDGAGSSRGGHFKDYTNEQMKIARRAEQKRAARIGNYAAAVLLNYESGEIKQAENLNFENDLLKLFSLINPHTVYIHNLADKHATHVATALKTLSALRKLPNEQKPKKVYACEVWRGLDWLPEEYKVHFDLTGGDKLALKLLSSFKSQISGGKRYDLATLGRWQANATYGEARIIDKAQRVAIATDLTDLINSDQNPAVFIKEILDKFTSGVITNLVN